MGLTYLQVIKKSDVTILWNLKNYPRQVQMHMKYQIETIQHLKKNESSKIFWKGQEQMLKQIKWTILTNNWRGKKLDSELWRVKKVRLENNFKNYMAIHGDVGSPTIKTLT
jgi:hypothetical protein